MEYEGWLHKGASRDFSKKKENKRFFVVQDNWLCYGPTEKEFDKARLPLLEYVEVQPLVSDKKKDAGYFCVTMGREQIWLIAKNESARDKWVCAIRSNTTIAQVGADFINEAVRDFIRNIVEDEINARNRARHAYGGGGVIGGGQMLVGGAYPSHQPMASPQFPGGGPISAVGQSYGAPASSPYSPAAASNPYAAASPAFPSTPPIARQPSGMMTNPAGVGADGGGYGSAPSAQLPMNPPVMRSGSQMALSPGGYMKPPFAPKAAVPSVLPTPASVAGADDGYGDYGYGAGTMAQPQAPRSAPRVPGAAPVVASAADYGYGGDYGGSGAAPQPPVPSSMPRMAGAGYGQQNYAQQDDSAFYGDY